ncbi:MAG: FecR domain-containing protein [Bacteroidota bacterium]
MDTEQQIIRILSGMGDAADEEAVAQFRRENPQEYELIVQVWQRSKPQFQAFDSEKAWKQIQPELTHPAPVKKRWMLISAVVGIAATILFALLIPRIFAPHPQDDWITIHNQDFVQQKIVLPDESEVYLAPDAVLSYPSTFDGDQRNIQFKGKGFFDIQKRPEQPFVVALDDAEVKVLGTSFQIEAHDTTTYVAVTSGKVQFRKRSNGRGVLLVKGEQGEIQEGQLSKSPITRENMDAWHTGYFSFDQAPIDTVLLTLNTYYGPVFHSDLAPLRPCRITMQTQAQSPSEVAEIIQLICGLSFSQDQKTITFSK